MKFVFITLILLPLMSSAQIGLTIQQQDTPQDVASMTFVFACGIEKYCATGTYTPYDTSVVAQKDMISKTYFGGAKCSDMASVLPTAADFKAWAQGLAMSGDVSCLASIP